MRFSSSSLWSLYTTGSPDLKTGSLFCAVAGLGLKDIVQGEQASHAGQMCGSPYRSPQNSQIHEPRGDRRKKLVFISMVCASVNV